MLCRVADSLFWMSRYIERAENTARLVDVNLQLLLESEHQDEEVEENHWRPILHSTGDLGLFLTLFERAESRDVTTFLTFSRDNPSSVMSCVYAARENARMIRDQISSEMWEVINRMYLFLRGQDSDRVWEGEPYQFFKEIKEYSHLFQGLTEATYPHKLGYEFIKAGKFLERADKTGRILDIKHHLLLPKPSDLGGAMDIAGWIALLRACSGLEAYHRIYVSDVIPRNVAEFLILSRDFPRSIFFSLDQLDLSLHSISGCPRTHYANESERVCGKMISDLKFTTTEEILREGLHEYLDRVQNSIEQIGIKLAEHYMFFPITDPAAKVEMEQEQIQAN